MSRQWAEERQEIENATLKLQQEMDGKVEKRAQVKIKGFYLLSWFRCSRLNSEFVTPR